MSLLNNEDQAEFESEYESYGLHHTSYDNKGIFICQALERLWVRDKIKREIKDEIVRIEQGFKESFQHYSARFRNLIAKREIFMPALSAPSRMEKFNFFDKARFVRVAHKCTKWVEKSNMGFRDIVGEAYNEEDRISTMITRDAYNPNCSWYGTEVRDFRSQKSLTYTRTNSRNWKNQDNATSSNSSTPSSSSSALPSSSYPRNPSDTQQTQYQDRNNSSSHSQNNSSSHSQNNSKDFNYGSRPPSRNGSDIINTPSSSSNSNRHGNSSQFSNQRLPAPAPNQPTAVRFDQDKPKSIRTISDAHDVESDQHSPGNGYSSITDTDSDAEEQFNPAQSGSVHMIAIASAKTSTQQPRDFVVAHITPESTCANGLVDTGAEFNIMSNTFYQRHLKKHNIKCKGSTVEFNSVCGNRLFVHGIVHTDSFLLAVVPDKLFSLDFIVCSQVGSDLILGKPAMEALGLTAGVSGNNITVVMKSGDKYLEIPTVAKSSLQKK